MSRFAVECGNLDGEAYTLNSIAKALQQQKSDVLSARQQITSVLNIGQGVVVNSQLRQMASRIEALGNKTAQYGNQLSAISDCYRKTESKLADYTLIDTSSTTISNTGADSSNTASASNDAFDMKWDDLILKCIGKFGVIGSSVSAVGKIVTGGATAKNWLKMGKSVVSSIGSIAGKGDKSWKTVLTGFGESALKKVDTSSISSIFSSKLGREFSAYSFKNATTVGDKIKVGTKWIGVAISGITNGISNYQDYKDGKMSGARAVAETVSETVVDVGINATATAAATAAVSAITLAATGTATAPVLVVGAVSVGVVWAADAVTRKITGALGEEKGLTETVSDAILDVGQGIYEGGKQAISNIKNAITNPGKLICNWAW